MSSKAPGIEADDLNWPPPARLFAAIALTFVVLFGLTLLLPHDPYIRYQQLVKTIQFRSQWVYERTALDPTPIDVALVGNSRLEAGVSAPQLQRDLRNLTGRPLQVANLSMPQEGRNMHYAIVKRLLEKHPEVKLIVLSAIEQMPRDGHPAFRDLADTDDVLSAPVIVNRDYANDVAVLPFRQISLFVQSLLPTWFGDKTGLDKHHYAGTGLDTTLSFRSPSGHLVDRDTIHSEAELTAAARDRIGGITRTLLPTAQADYEFAVERTYTRRIAALARAHGVKLLFLYLPIYKDREPVADAPFYKAFGSVVQADFLAGDHRLYSDYGHLNVYGSRLVAPWLADRIVESGTLVPKPPAAPHQ